MSRRASGRQHRLFARLDKTVVPAAIPVVVELYYPGFVPILR